MKILALGITRCYGFFALMNGGTRMSDEI